MDDATVAVEVAACEALVQWPYLSDMTLIWALASIFLLPPPISAHSHVRTCTGFASRLPSTVALRHRFISLPRVRTALTKVTTHICRGSAVVQACRSRLE